MNKFSIAKPDWQENPVLTTVTSTALPVTKVDFPAVTIWC